MADIMAACMMICAGLNTCTEDLCNSLITSMGGTLNINCRTSMPVKFSDITDKDLRYHTIHVHQCSLDTFSEEDAQVLKSMKINQLFLMSTFLSTLQPLKVLQNDLQRLSIMGCAMNDDVAATIPSLPKLRALILSNNLLTEIPGSVRSFYELLELDLSNNNIKVLDFSFLPTTVSEIRLKSNRIRSVISSKDMYSLKTLDLSINQIKDIGWLSYSTFPLLCQQINLKSNQITSFKADNVNFLPELQYLDVSYNNITWIGDLAREDTISRKESLNLEYNPLYCNCSLSYFVEDAVWKTQKLPKCANPADFRDVTLKGFIESAGCDEVDQAGRLDSGDLDEKTPQQNTVAIVCVVGGLACLVGAAVGIGTIAQKRRVVTVDEVKQAPKNRTAPNTSGGAPDKKNLLLRNMMDEADETNEADGEVVDQYLQRRRLDVNQAADYVLEKLSEISKSDRKLKLSEKIEVCLEVRALQGITQEVVDASDMCMLMVKEWPIAPCNTPMELYIGMYYDGNMEEWPMTALNTRTCSTSDINCILETTNDTILSQTKSFTPKVLKKNFLSTIELRVPPTSVATLRPGNNDTDINAIINNIDGW